MKKNKVQVWVLLNIYGDYEDRTKDIKGVTSNWDHAQAWEQTGWPMYSSREEVHEIELVTLDVLDVDVLTQIKNWLDPNKNPMCECGHRLLHHSKKRCRHNTSYYSKADPNRHVCNGFRLVTKP